MLALQDALSYRVHFPSLGWPQTPGLLAVGSVQCNLHLNQHGGKRLLWGQSQSYRIRHHDDLGTWSKNGWSSMLLGWTKWKLSKPMGWWYPGILPRHISIHFLVYVLPLSLPLGFPPCSFPWILPEHWRKSEAENFNGWQVEMNQSGRLASPTKCWMICQNVICQNDMPQNAECLKQHVFRMHDQKGVPWHRHGCRAWRIMTSSS